MRSGDDEPEAEASMQVTVKLFSRFREQLPPEARGEATLELATGTTVDELLDCWDLGERVKLVTVNGERVQDRSRALADEDRVHVFPIVVGG